MRQLFPSSLLLLLLRAALAACFTIIASPRSAMKPVRVAIRAGARRASRRQWLAPPVRRSFSQATALLNQQSEQREMTGDGSFATTALVQGLKNSKDPVVSAEIANFLRRNEHRQSSGSEAICMPQANPHPRRP